MKTKWCGIAFAVIVAALLSCDSDEQTLTWPEVQQMIDRDYPGVLSISTAQLSEWLASPETQPVVLDARAPEEYDVSHIQSARLAPTVDEANQYLGGLEEGQPIVVYCSVGYRSARLAKRLSEAGYENVYNLQGSIFQWANEGRPVYHEDEEVGKVHPYDEHWGQLLKAPLRAESDTSQRGEK